MIHRRALQSGHRVGQPFRPRASADPYEQAGGGAPLDLAAPVVDLHPDPAVGGAADADGAGDGEIGVDLDLAGVAGDVERAAAVRRLTW